MLYKTTYKGDHDDSDDDPYHITMPFKHSEELHHQILNDLQFESDEDYCMEPEAQDKLNSEMLEK